MTLLSLFKNSNNSNPQTLILGEDSFLNDYLARSYTHEERFNDLERISIDCESDGLDELIADLTESSLFSQQKIITVKNPFFLTAKVPKKMQKQLEQLQEIFANLQQLDDIVVLVASYEKVDRRKKLTKTVLQQFNVIETKVKTYEVGAITKALITAEGYQISRTGLQLLLQRSDQVLDTILGNYNKLKMIAVDGKITEQAIEQNVDLSLAQNVFAILEAALKHNYQEAISRLDNQLREGSNPIQLLAVFENQLELILAAKILQKRGRNESQIVKELGVHPYRVKLALSNRLALKKLMNLLEEAIKLDFNYKNGQYREDNFLKLFILNV
ncbi:DNA polymerase III subunit delta [Lactobacillus sp. ESL0731]|uniref:DNA polymerase III subunit delta n=1 Tax=unclassified Lactobacillus TaxID=2620435 RepID=UPI0023F9178E|nr:MULTISPECIES: DNA polymerase III subunit delta [unclassified Lactobacillus]WEV51956.1 DNA polymerase III subunit delta [Lactobacillus sp. ESL0700]WEV63087.1 DNA polymerase III subunit delta [Lactobacillus sp. ESL0731]